MRLAAAIVVLVAVGSALGASRPSSTEWRPRGAILRGDVTGDGKLDRTVLEHGPQRTCRFRLVVRSDSGILTSRVRPDICDSKPSEVYSGPDPHVAVLADLDGRRGLEVVVQLGRGAHTEFADLWAVRDEKLRRFAGPEPQISFGGSVGTGSHFVDCARQPGVVLVSTRVYDHPARVVRTWYRSQDLRLRRLRSRMIRWPAEEAVTFREFGHPQPFPSCAKARAPR